jgi:YD repeat-containing protein
VTDPAKRITTHTYDEANRPKEITYSDGKTHAVEYENNGDGKFTHMTDGTGESTYKYDELDRLTESQNGHKEKVSYEYDLAKGTETPASLAYTRDSNGQLKGITSKGLPGEEKPAYEYDTNSRLSKGAGTAYASFTYAPTGTPPAPPESVTVGRVAHCHKLASLCEPSVSQRRLCDACVIPAAASW